MAQAASMILTQVSSLTMGTLSVLKQVLRYRLTRDPERTYTHAVCMDAALAMQQIRHPQLQEFDELCVRPLHSPEHNQGDAEGMQLLHKSCQPHPAVWDVLLEVIEEYLTRKQPQGYAPGDQHWAGGVLVHTQLLRAGEERITSAAHTQSPSRVSHYALVQYRPRQGRRCVC